MLALARLAQIVARPGVLAALDPRYALAYLGHADAWIALRAVSSTLAI